VHVILRFAQDDVHGTPTKPTDPEHSVNETNLIRSGATAPVVNPAVEDPADDVLALREHGGRGPLIGGIDIGGTKLAVGVTDAAGNLLAQRRQPSLVQRGPDAVVGDIIAMVRDATAEAAAKIDADGAELGFLSVASPGPLSQTRGVILSTPNMPGWEGYPLIERLRDAFACPTKLENDANAACLGEALFGAGRGKRFVAYFTISTGVGGGFVQDGRVLHGSDGNAAEFGHQIVVPFNGALCGCGGYGHVESYCNGAGISRRAKEHIANGQATNLLDIAGSLDAITPRHIAEAAGAGDRLCLEVWEETATLLSIGIVNVIHNFNPNIVVLGGGITHVGDLLFGPVLRAVDARVMKDYRGSFTVERATLGDQVGIMGAVGLALEHGILQTAA
jgi:glucokinase